MVTMKDVAKFAGVSVATVSRVLSGGKNVSPHQRLNVLGAVKTLGYVINISARNLSTMQSPSIGVVIPEGGCHDPGFCYLAESLIRLADTYKKNLIIREAGFSPEAEQNTLKTLSAQGCVLIIFQPSQARAQEIEEYIREINTPVIVIDRKINSAATVWCDYFNAARQCIDLLIRCGHQNILLSGNFSRYMDRKILQGYRVALKNHGISFQNSLIVDANSSVNKKEFKICDMLSNDLFSAAIFIDIQDYYIYKNNKNFVSNILSPVTMSFTLKPEALNEHPDLNTIIFPYDDVAKKLTDAAERIILGDTSIINFSVKGIINIMSDITYSK